MLGGGFGNIFKIPELKKRILFTLAMLAVYRVGIFVPTPGVGSSANETAFPSVIVSVASNSNPRVMVGSFFDLMV